MEWGRWVYLQWIHVIMCEMERDLKRDENGECGLLSVTCMSIMCEVGREIKTWWRRWVSLCNTHSIMCEVERDRERGRER